MLSKQFISKQRESLLSEKKRLENEVAKLSKYPDYGDMLEDNDLELRDYENNQSITDELRGLLGQIDKAIESIDKGTYGKCASCQKLISEDRLISMPYATTCVECSLDE